MKIKRSHRWKVRRGADGEWHQVAPAAHMKVGNARGFAATILNLPVEAICLVNRNGRAARSDKRIGDLRIEWFGKS